MATTPELHEPQIAAARAKAWHQDAPPNAGTVGQGTPADSAATISSLTQDTATPPSRQDQAEETEAAGGPQAPESSTDQDPVTNSAEHADLSDSNGQASEAAQPGASATEGANGAETAEPLPARAVSAQPQRLLTLEAARDFVNRFGLVLFGPRSLGAPAPSLVEATLGAARTSVTPAEAATARSLAARLVAEGSAVPLNLLGGPGDVPDFLVSTAAFPFIFTLRGDKGWKRPPETSGAVKVTTLALHVYETLTAKGPLTVGEIVTEVGREITESAVSRALTELWSLLRVVPSLQQGEGVTIWELTTARFLKAVKAGANAGQPTALSALISLYLGQVFLATEEEISAFLSPLTARSRVRDVLHGLSAGRQLSEAVLEGKTVLFIPDSLPDFASAAPSFAAPLPASTPERGAADHSGEGSKGQGPERIRRFEGEAGGRDRTLRGKPAARSRDARPGSRSAGASGGGRPFQQREDRPARSFGDRPSRPFGDRSPRPFGDRPPRPFGDRPARPFTPRETGTGEKPSFARPWDEERRDRPSRPDAGRDDRGARPSFGARDGRPPRRESEPGRPAFGGRDRGERPPFRREGAPSRPSGGSFPSRRRDQDAEPSRPFRPGFAPGRDAGAADRDDRPARRESFEGNAFPRRNDRNDREERGNRDRGERDAGGEDRRPFRPAADRPFNADRPRKNFDRPSREGAPGRPFGGFRPREGGGAEGTSRPGNRGPQSRPPFRDRGEGGFGGNRPNRSFGDRPQRSFPDRPSREGQESGERPFRKAPGASSGFKRPAAGGFNRDPAGASRGPGGFSRGPGRPERGDRPNREGRTSQGDRPFAPRRRPEDEA